MVVAPVTARVLVRYVAPWAVNALPEGIVMPTVENWTVLTPKTAIQTEPEPERYKPVFVSFK
jgi:hypothetical protein